MFLNFGGKHPEERLKGHKVDLVFYNFIFAESS